jgi:hypothetical protein
LPLLSKSASALIFRCLDTIPVRYVIVHLKEVQDMRHARATILSTAALGLAALAAPTYAQVGPNQGYYLYQGHYYRLLPVKGSLPAQIPPGYTAAAPAPASNCFLTNFENHGGAQPMYVTACGL